MRSVTREERAAQETTKAQNWAKPQRNFWKPRKNIQQKLYKSTEVITIVDYKGSLINYV